MIRLEMPDNPHTPGNLEPNSQKHETDDDMRCRENYSNGNIKARYYCEKTREMQQSLNEIIEDIVRAQTYAMAYLVQDPPTTDHCILSMVFHLIEKTASMINWKELNHDCFWKDFRRETRDLRFLLETVQMAALEASHTATNLANRAFEILNKVVTVEEKVSDAKLRASSSQCLVPDASDIIKIVWTEPNESVMVEWHDEQTIHVVKLNETEQSFRLRLLRSLLRYARDGLEAVLFTLYRVDIAMRLECPLDKLAKCNGLTAGQLVPLERLQLARSKGEFDGKWNDILIAVSKIKFQVDQLEIHRNTLKKMWKDASSCPKLLPEIEFVSLVVECPVVVHLVSDAITAEIECESYDFCMYSDRTDDIIAIIESIWGDVDRDSYKKMDQLLVLSYTALSQIQSLLNPKEESFFRRNVGELIIQRDRTKRYLKQALDKFNHQAFNGMPIHQNGYNAGSLGLFSKSHSTNESLEEENDSSDEDEKCADKYNRIEGAGGVELIGGFTVSISEHKEFLVMNSSRKQLRFGELDDEQKVVLTKKVIERLLHYVASEASLSKILLENASETKSLVKRLKTQARANERLSSVVGNGVYHILQTLRLMKSMDILRSVPNT